MNMGKIKKNNNRFNKRGSALIMIVLMFAMLLVLGTGAGIVAASSSHNSIRETKQEQAYIAARSVALAIKDEIVNSENPETLVANLNNTESINADFLEDTSYDLDITELSEDSFMFTVTAVTASATEKYSFVMNKSEEIVGNPVLGNATSFLRGSKNVTGNNGSGVEGDVYIHDYSLVTLKANIFGSVFINSKQNQDINLELGTITGSDDYDDPSRKLGLVAGGPINNQGTPSDTKVVLKVRVNGDIYVRGDVKFETNDAFVDGNLYASGNVEYDSDKVTGTVKSNIDLANESNPDSIRLNHYLEMLNTLDDLYDEKEIDLVPDWASDILNANDSSITYHETIEVDKMTRDIEVSSNLSNGYYNVLLKNEGNSKVITLKHNIVTKGDGKIRFILEKNMDMHFETGAIATDNPRPDALNNYLVSEGNSNIIIKTSLYAYTYILGQGNDGLASGSVNFQNNSLPGYYKLYGSVFAANISFNQADDDIVRYPNADPSSGGGSGNGTSTLTSWNYSGVTSSE